MKFAESSKFLKVTILYSCDENVSASRSHSMQLCQPKFFTPIYSELFGKVFNRFQHVLGFEPTRKILIPSSRAVKE